MRESLLSISIFIGRVQCLDATPSIPVTLTNDLHTGDPLLVWTGTKLLDVQRAEALSVAHERVNETLYLFIERGGFSPDHEMGWTSPWLVFEKQ